MTGSARLDVYRFGGDSLQGRYHHARLLPLSARELGGREDALAALMELSGFPEPFYSGSAVAARRWSREYHARVVREDVRDLENLKDLASVELLLSYLPECVGSPLSYNSLREKLQVAHKTVMNWIDVLERLYLVFRIPPFGSARVRAVKKEQKLYFLDWTRVQPPAFRFENLVGAHLLKHCCWLQDSEGRDVELRYFRDTDGREVDFVVTENRKPVLLVECKLGDDQVSPHLKYLAAKFPGVPAWQVHLQGVRSFRSKEGIRVASATALLSELSA